MVPFRENVATTIGIYFDGISGNLTFYKDGHNLGVAFTGLHEVNTNFPSVYLVAVFNKLTITNIRIVKISTLGDRAVVPDRVQHRR